MLKVFNVVDVTESESEAMAQAFSEDVNKFKEVMSPLMGQILGWRRDKVKANLNNLDLSPMVFFVDGRLKFPIGMDETRNRLNHLATCVGAKRYSDEAISTLEAEFRAAGGTQHLVRGKYLMWLMAQALVHMHRDIAGFVFAYKKPPKVKVSTGPANVMVTAAPRARIPATLRQFIESTFSVHIAEIALA